MMNLTFDGLREKNVARCEQVFHALDHWSPTDWACALAGEVGEACNVAKKMRRGDKGEFTKALAKELADVVIYADLLAARMGIDLGEEVVKKFNEVSLKRLSDIHLLVDDAGDHMIGRFFQFDHPNGSVGIIRERHGGFFYGRYYYGKDVNGEYMTAITGRINLREIKYISREEFMKTANSPGFGRGD